MICCRRIILLLANFFRYQLWAAICLRSSPVTAKPAYQAGLIEGARRMKEAARRLAFNSLNAPENPERYYLAEEMRALDHEAIAKEAGDAQTP